MSEFKNLNLVLYLNNGLTELPVVNKATISYKVDADKLRKYRHYAAHGKKARTRKKYRRILRQIDPGYKTMLYYEETGTKWWLRRPGTEKWTEMETVPAHYRWYLAPLPVNPFVRATFEKPTVCNCWQCQAERMYGAKRTTPMRGLQIGKVYLYQLYNETVEEFETIAEANLFRAYADANIPYWDYDPVNTIDLNDPKQIEKYRARGWIKEETNDTCDNNPDH